MVMYDPQKLTKSPKPTLQTVLLQIEDIIWREHKSRNTIYLYDIGDY